LRRRDEEDKYEYDFYFQGRGKRGGLMCTWASGVKSGKQERKNLTATHSVNIVEI